MLNKAPQLIRWVQSGDLAAEQLPAALAVTEALPDGSKTLHFLDRLLLIAAIFCLCSAVIFFFAYNWNDMTRLQKFALAQAALLVAHVPLLRYPLQHWIAQSSLFAAGLLLGAWLAVIGQTYQTGADVFELFLIWALLLLPWTLLGRSMALTGLMLVLLNLSLFLALPLLHTVLDRMDYDKEVFTPFLAFFALNCVAWLILQFVRPQQRGLPWRIVTNLLLCYVLVILTIWCILSISSIGYRYGLSLAHVLWFLVAGKLLWDSLIRLNPPVLTLLCLCTILLLLAWLGRLLGYDNVSSWFIQAMVILGVATSYGHWLKKRLQDAGHA